jgi:uncharacterized protein (TIGR03086 family)
MTEVSERYGVIADGFTARVEGVGADRWSAPTPCTEWTAKDLLAHVIGVHRGMVAGLDGSQPAEVDLEADLAVQWRAARAALAEAVGDPAVASTLITAGNFGEQPFESVVGRLVCTDTLVHTWDLAKATGQDERLDPAAVATAMDSLGPLDEAIRFPGGFGPKIDPEPGADEQTRFLNFCGRAG